jgi:hypothetical protein
MAAKNVLLVGESWATSATHTEGFDQFGSVTFHLGAEPLVAALKGSDFDLTYMPAHEVATAFRSTSMTSCVTPLSYFPTSARILFSCRRMSGFTACQRARWRFEACGGFVPNCDVHERGRLRALRRAITFNISVAAATDRVTTIQPTSAIRPRSTKARRSASGQWRRLKRDR